MRRSTSPANSSAGQRTSASPDYAPPASPHNSSAGQRTSGSPHYTPSNSPHYYSAGQRISDSPDHAQSDALSDYDEDDDVGNPEGVMPDGSSDFSENHYSDEFEDDLTVEVYDNSDKRVFYDSDGEDEPVIEDDANDVSNGVVYQSIEFDEPDINQPVGNSNVDRNIPQDHTGAGDASAGQADRQNSPDNSSMAKLMASCVDTDPSLFHDLLAQRKTLTVEFLELNHDVLEQVLTRNPHFVQDFLRRNYKQTESLFVDDPRWLIERYLNAFPKVAESYLGTHPNYVHKCIHDNPLYFDQYLARHSETTQRYLGNHPHYVHKFIYDNPVYFDRYLARHPEFAERYLGNHPDYVHEFIHENPFYFDQYLARHPEFAERYLDSHRGYVRGYIHENPVYYDRYLVRHPEFVINYLNHNRLPSGFGLPPDRFGITRLPPCTEPPPITSSLPSAGLPSPNSSPPPLPSLPPPSPPLFSPSPPATDPPEHQPTTGKARATHKPPAKSASNSRPSSTKAAPGNNSQKAPQRPPQSATAVSAAASSSAKEPVTPSSAPKKMTGPSPHKSATSAVAVASSSSSSSVQTYNVILTSTYNQPPGQFMAYPAPAGLLAASRKQDAGTKGSWRLFEEDSAIKHMLDVRDEGQIAGEKRFEEVTARLKTEGIERGFFAVKNYWNRTGRARSGFDERKNKTAPLATSKQGKEFRKAVKAKSKKRKGKGVKVQSEDEDDDENEDDDGESDGYSVYSEEETTPPPTPRLKLRPAPAPAPPPRLKLRPAPDLVIDPALDPALAPAPAPAPLPPQPPSQKRPADFDDEALARAQSYGTRPKKPRTG